MEADFDAMLAAHEQVVANVLAEFRQKLDAATGMLEKTVTDRDAALARAVAAEEAAASGLSAAAAAGIRRRLAALDAQLEQLIAKHDPAPPADPKEKSHA